jgi:hypothetical protein
MIRSKLYQHVILTAIVFAGLAVGLSSTLTTANPQTLLHPDPLSVSGQVEQGS